MKKSIIFAASAALLFPAVMTSCKGKTAQEENVAP